MLAAAVLAATLVSALPAAAAAPTGRYRYFAYCPYTNPAVQSCLYSVSSSGSLQLGNQTVPISAPVTLRGGFAVSDAGRTTFFDAVGASTLSKTKLAVPGGLLGLTGTAGSPNDVYATAELVAPVKFNYIAYLFQDKPAIVLSLRVHLENPALGPACYIGSPSKPIMLKLTDGTTAPPPPNTPITGYGGDLVTSADSTIVNAYHVKLVDNAFAVPGGANGCGSTPAEQPVVNALVNAKVGLPSPAGKNTAILGGDTKIADATAVLANANPAG